MEKTAWKQYKEIALRDLALWDENARFPEEYFKKTEEELIAYFLKDEKTFEIKKLAKEMVAELDIPQFEPLLVYTLNETNIVMEGNRRLAVYKLLANPNLTAEQETRKFFSELNKRANISNDSILRANVTNNLEEAYRYIDRKHNKKNNEVSWTGTERTHFNVRRNRGNNKAIAKVEISRKIKSLDIDDEITSSVLGKGYETTLWRIIENPSAKDKLSYEIKEDGSLKIKNKGKFNDLLKIIVYNVWKKQAFDGSGVNSRDLNKTDQIVQYLDGLKAQNTKKVDEEIKKTKASNENLFGEKKMPKKDGQTKKNIYGSRIQIFKSLIDSKKLLPKVKLQKIKEVFKELQIIYVKECPTATFALVRILTDITIKTFLDLKGYKFNNYGHLIITNGKENNKIELKEKMNYIATNYLTGDLQGSVVALNEDLLTQNLNQVMHNTIFSASETQIRKFWGNLLPFLEFLWEEIIKTENRK